MPLAFFPKKRILIEVFIVFCLHTRLINPKGRSQSSFFGGVNVMRFRIDGVIHCLYYYYYYYV